MYSVTGDDPVDHDMGGMNALELEFTYKSLRHRGQPGLGCSEGCEFRLALRKGTSL